MALKGLAALAGAISGIAEGVTAEDKKRDELTKVTLAQQLKNIEAAKEFARTKREASTQEAKAVEALMGTVVPMKDGTKQQITRAQALKAVRQFGAKEVNSLLLEGKLAFEGAGEITKGEATTRGALDLEALEGTDAAGGGGLFSTGRMESVKSNTASLLKSMGYDPEGVEVDGELNVTGVSISGGPAMGKTTRDTMYTDSPAGIGGMVVRVTKTDATGKATTRYEDLTGKDITSTFSESIRSGSYKLSNAAIDTKIERGVAFRFDKLGRPQVIPAAIGIRPDGSAWYLDDKGDFTVKVTEKDTLTMSSAMYNAIAPDGDASALSALGAKGTAQLVETMDKAEALEQFKYLAGENVKLIQSYDNPDVITSDIGSAAELLKWVTTELGVAASVIGDVTGINIEGLEIAANNAQSYIDSVDTENMSVATARKVFRARQIIMIYTRAKAMDNRVTDADFENFANTATASSAEGQMELYRAQADAMLNEYRSSFLSLTTYVTTEAGNAVVNNLAKERSPDLMRAAVDEALGPYDPKAKSKTYEPSIDDFKVQEVYVKGNEVLSRAEPGAKKVFVYMNTFTNEPMRMNGSLLLDTDKETAERGLPQLFSTIYTTK